MTLSELVERSVSQSPFISEALQANIVNISSLARLIQPDIVSQLGEEVSVSAIAMAINRLPVSPDLQLAKSISRFMRQLGDLTVRSDLSDYSYRNSATLIECQSTLLGYLQDDKSYFYSFCKGVHETTLICSETLSHKIEEIFVNEKKIMTRSGLAAVSVKLPPTNLDTYGVYYTILKRLAWKGINIVEVLSTSHEISLVISNKDVEKVFSIILALKHGR